MECTATPLFLKYLFGLFKVTYIFLCVPVLFFSFKPVSATVIPNGWREPFGEEVSQNWRLDNTEKYLSITGDFNGDGLNDEAKILVNKNKKNMALFVFLLKKNGLTQTIQLSQLNVHLLGQLGVSIANKGSYETLCGKGYYTCGKNEESSVFLKNVGIYYFSYQQGASIFMWSGKLKRFVEVVVTD